MSTVWSVALLKESSAAHKKENQDSAQNNSHNVLVVHPLSEVLEGSVDVFQFWNIYTHIMRNLGGRTRYAHEIHSCSCTLYTCRLEAMLYRSRS